MVALALASPPAINKTKPCATLSKLRQGQNLTRYRLSQKTGLAVITLKKIETGEELPSPAARGKLCRFFKLTEQELFPELSRRDLSQVYEPRPYPLCIKLKEVRVEKGWTQFQLANLCAMVAVPGKEGSRLDASQLSKFEIGTRQPWRVAIVRLCVVLNLSVKELFPELIEAGTLNRWEDLEELIISTRRLNGRVLAAVMRNF